MPRRNETRARFALSAALALSGLNAQAADEAWFAASPCHHSEASAPITVDGKALLSVHDHPGEAPHDALLRRDDDGRWWVEETEWQRWTRLPAPETLQENDGARWVALSGNPLLHMRLDACTAELWVQLGAPPRIHYALRHDGEDLPTTPATPGGFVNLDTRYGGFNRRGETRSLIDLGAFAGLSSLRSGVLLGDGPPRRLDSTLLFDDPVRAQRLRLGDAISRGSSWQASARYAGVQWGSDYSLLPSRLLFPLPSLDGSATLPSTVDLFVNGQRVAQQQVAAGPYRLSGVPVLSGAGELQMVVRDALGHEQSLSLPFYSSQRLLLPNLSDYSIEAGFLRARYASENDRYTHPFAAYSLRQGVNEALSAGLHIEFRNRATMFGASADARLGTLGLLGAAAAVSHSGEGLGAIGQLSFEHLGPHLGLSLSRRQATHDYADLAQAPHMLRSQDQLRLSLNDAQAGSLSALYLRQADWQGPAQPLSGLSYSVQLRGNCYFYASYLHPLRAGSQDSLMLGFNLLLGPRSSAGMQWTHSAPRDSQQVYAQSSRDGALGWSWRSRYDHSEYGAREAQAEYASAHGLVSAGFAGFDGDARPTLAASTGFAWLDGKAWWTQPAQRSFAVVDTGEPGVRVYRDNLLVGRSGADGRLLVPDLRPYEPNHLSIEPEDLPLELALARKDEWLSPPASAGVKLRFALAQQRALQLHLYEVDGRPPPVGAELFLDARRLPLPLGRDGLVYAEISTGTHQLQARWPQARCQATLQVENDQARLGPCRR